jgi:BirA family biotin operon repressor/biotin-[acetyl-CoA-carboxylase] ligase
MTERTIRQRLRTKHLGHKIYCFVTIDSTNSYAKSLAHQGIAEGALVIAEKQTEGRGRLGRTWTSEGGKNLTFSLLLRPTIQPGSIGILSLAAGVAVTQTIREVSGLAAECKWPNDVLVDGRKVCGILSEGIFHREQLVAVVMGIGLNVNQTSFAEDLFEKATSIHVETGRDWDRIELLASVLGQLDQLYERVCTEHPRHILDLWQQSSRMIGQQITVSQHGRMIAGTAKSLDDDGGLILQSNGDEIKVVAGDVTVVRQ